MFANSQMTGLDMAAPDVCLTPSPAGPVPVPYPNMAMGNMAIPNVLTIFIMGMPVHNLGTTVAMTNGDNAGVSMGVASGTVMGPSRHITGCNTVLFMGMPATRMTSSTLQNSTNISGVRIAPSQTLVMMLAP